MSGRAGKITGDLQLIAGPIAKYGTGSLSAAGDATVAGTAKVTTQLLVGTATQTIATKAEIRNAGVQLLLSYDGANYTEISTGVTGDLSFTPTGSDVFMTSGVTLHSNTINETTTDSGVTIEGVLIKDNDVLIPSGDTVNFATASHTIGGDGTDVTVTTTGDINLNAAIDINVPADVGLTFGGDTQKVEGNGTDLTLNSAADINLTAVADVNIPSGVGLKFGGDAQGIEFNLGE